MDSRPMDVEKVYDRLSMVERRLSVLQERVQALEMRGSGFGGGVLDMLGDSPSSLPSHWEQQMDRLCEETCHTLLVDSCEAEQRLVYSKQEIMDARRAMRPFPPLSVYRELVEEPLPSPEEVSVVLQDPLTQRRSKEHSGRVSDHFPRTKQQQPSPRNRNHHESKVSKLRTASSDELMSPPKKTPSKKSPKSVRDVAMCHGLLIEPPDSD